MNLNFDRQMMDHIRNEGEIMDDPECKNTCKIENIQEMDILSKVFDMNSILGKSF